MKVLMLSIDAKIFEAGSPVAKRMAEYGSIVDELHIAVYTRPGFSKVKLAPNVWAYPTNSSAISYFWKSYTLGVKILNIADDFIITSQDAFTNLVAFCLRSKFGAKVEIQIHTDCLSPYFIKESLKNRLRSFLYLWSARNADHVRVVSERIATSLVKRNVDRKKITVLPIFVDVEKIKNTPASFDLHQKYPQFEKIVLIVSRLSREKNIPLALEAMAQVVKNNPKIGLVIVGDGPERKKLEILITGLNIEKNVKFEGWQKDTISYYKTADVFLQTSFYEGYGMSIVEASICGVLIISTEVGVACDVSDKLVLFRPKDIAEAIFSTDKKIKTTPNFLSQESYLKKQKQSWGKL